MEDNKLKYLEKVAEYGSISKAAEELFITSSALSKYIKKIEDDYGIKLYDRIGKRFELTYAGQRYLKWLSDIDSMYGQMEDEMHDIANSYVGRLRVGVQTGGSNDIIEKVMPEFFDQFPGILFEMEEDISSNLRQQLEHNELDLAILPDQGLYSDLETIRLKHEQLVLVAPKNHDIGRLASSRDGFTYPWIDISSFPDIPFIAPFPDQGAYQPFSLLEGEYDISFRIIMRARTISRILRCVRMGIGCTLTPDTHILSSAYPEDLELYSVGKEPHNSELVIARNRSHYLTHPAEVFIDLCSRACQ